MSLSYTTFTTTLANFLVIPIGDTNLAQAMTAIIDQAEQNIYRDLDLLNTVGRDSSGHLTAGSRTFTEPNTGTNPFIVTQQLSVITPAGTLDPDSGTRNQLLPASKEM